MRPIGLTPIMAIVVFACVLVLPAAAQQSPASAPSVSSGATVQQFLDYKTLLSNETHDFEDFLKEIIGSLVVVVGTVFAFLNWKTRKDIDTSVRENMDVIISKIIQEHIPNIEAAAKSSIAKAETEIKEYISDMQNNLNSEIAKRNSRYDKWLVELSNDNAGMADAEIQPDGIEDSNVYDNVNILWVDDHPDNNEYQIGVVENLGSSVDRAKSTEDAMSRLLEGKSYNVVISDMGRKIGGECAGLTLLQEMKTHSINLPLIFFCSPAAVSRYANEALSKGAFAITNSDAGLFRALTSALQGRGPVGMMATSV